MRPLPALLGTLLLVVALAAPVAGANTTTPIGNTTVDDGPVSNATGDIRPRVTMVENLTNHLAIPSSDVRQAEYSSAGIDVGAAVAVSDSKLRREHERRTFEQTFYGADGESERVQLIRSKLDTIERRQRELSDRQQAQIQRYADGTAPAGSVVRTRALVTVRARELAGTLDTIDRLERSEPAFTMTSGQRTRLENVRGELRVLRGPVSDRLERTFRGSAPPHSVYVMTSTRDYMLATTTDQEYVRETHLASARNVDASDQFVASDTDPLRAAITRAEDLYPWLYAQQLPSVNAYGTSSIYQLTANHPSGQLRTYIDGGTTDVFHELQSLRLSTIRTTETRTAVNGTVRVDVARSYGTGPARISVRNNATGEPIAATVTVDEQRIGPTGADGDRWIVEPRGGYTVEVTTDGGTTVTVAVLGN